MSPLDLDPGATHGERGLDINSKIFQVFRRLVTVTTREITGDVQYIVPLLNILESRVRQILLSIGTSEENRNKVLSHNVHEVQWMVIGNKRGFETHFKYRLEDSST